MRFYRPLVIRSLVNSRGSATLRQRARSFLTKDESQPGCPFCPPTVCPRIVEELGSVFAIKDSFPVAPDHMLVIPYRHTHDFFTMTEQECNDTNNLLRIIQKKISANDPSVTGFNVGANCGISAGQSIMHAHIHLIPRRNGDTPRPRGGVRGVIPRKMDY